MSERDPAHRDPVMRGLVNEIVDLIQHGHGNLFDPETIDRAIEVMRPIADAWMMEHGKQSCPKCDGRRAQGWIGVTPAACLKDAVWGEWINRSMEIQK